MKLLIATSLVFLNVGAAERNSMQTKNEPIEIAENDSSKCTTGVREILSELKRKHGDVQFSCRNGFLQKLYAPSASELLRPTPEEFVRSNFDLFLPAGPNRSFHGDGHFQTYEGFPIWGGTAGRRENVRLVLEMQPKLRFSPPQYGMYYFSVIDTSNWSLKPRRVLSRDEVIKISEASVVSTGKSEEFRAHVEGLPHIIAQFCDGKPALAWRVHLIPRRMDSKSRGMFYVDAESGNVCNPRR